VHRGRLVPIDLPCTYRSATVLAGDLDKSTQLGFTSKCAVFAEQVDVINRALTPSDDDASAAGALIAAYEAQLSGRPIDAAPWVDAPDRNNATRLLRRHAAMLSFEGALQAARADDTRY
jgi:citrate lyase subunit beta/citryl-CoA lyase